MRAERSLAKILVLIGLVLGATGTGKAVAEKKVLWAGYYSGIWAANSDGSNPEHVMDTGAGAVYAGWHTRGLFWDPDSQKVYFTNRTDEESRIQRMNVDGSALEDIIAGSFMGLTNDVVLDSAGMIYWTDNSNNRIRRAFLDGTGRQDVYGTGSNQLCGLAIDPRMGKLYWTQFTSNQILRANLDGSACETLVTGLCNPRYIDLDLDGQKMYWTEYDSQVIRRANLDGSVIETLFTSPKVIGGISLDAQEGKMYWRDKDGLLRADLDGGNVERLTFAGSDTYPCDVVITPEPGGLSLLALGGLALVRRRRK